MSSSSLFVEGNEIDEVKHVTSLRGAASEVSQATLPFSLVELSGTECYGCAWSRGCNYFAWSCGLRVVKIARWSRLNDLTTRNSGELSDEAVTVIEEAGGIVHSLTFCQRYAVKQFGRKSERRRSSTTRFFNYCNDDDVTLVIGLKNGRIRTWDPQTGSLKMELCDHVGPITGLSFNSYGRPLLASSSMDGTLKLWDMEDGGNMIATLKSNSTKLYSCCCSPDGVTLASVGNYHSVHLWDLKTFKLRRRLEGHYNNVTGCDFSPDGILLATSSFDSRVIIWNVSCGVALRYLEHCSPPLSPIYAGGANDAYVRSVSFSSDGHHIATVCEDGYLRFWDIFDDVPVQAKQISGAIVCRFSSGGSMLAVGTSSGDVTVWRSPTRVASLQHLCRSVVRRLTSADAVELLFCVPPAIRRFLQYSDQISVA